MPPCYGALAITAENSFYTNRAIDLPAVQNEHINIKETAAVILSALRWGHLWKNKAVVVLTDNMTTKCILNKGLKSLL
jgi:hypothetical protein